MQKEQAMGHLVADENMLTRLGGIVTPIEIRDPDGKVLGHYTPVVSPELAAMYEKAKAMIDIKEIERRLREDRGQGVSLAEIWKKLGVETAQ
jgi:hypothetical protein